MRIFFNKAFMPYSERQRPMVFLVIRFSRPSEQKRELSSRQAQMDFRSAGRFRLPPIRNVIKNEYDVS